MGKKEKLEFLGNALVDGDAKDLSLCMAEDCRYRSDYAGVLVISRERILNRMQKIYDNVQNEIDHDCAYSYKLIKLRDILSNGIHMEDLRSRSPWDVYENGLLLYQGSSNDPVAVILVKFNENQEIAEIELSRKRKWFPFHFYLEEEIDPDVSSFEIPREESIVYSEPNKCPEILYEDDKLQLRRIWNWNDAVNIEYDWESSLLKIGLTNETFSRKYTKALATLEGDRITWQDLESISHFNEGLAIAELSGGKIGYLGTDGRFRIPPIYDEATEFEYGYARVKKNGKPLVLRKDGKEILTSDHYEMTGSFSEGRRRVSTMMIRIDELAYYDDGCGAAGLWGYIDEDGYEVIKPQYIFAKDFWNGIAIVCKGEWKKNPKWTDKRGRIRTWSDEVLFGAIDIHGNEVIPFVYDAMHSMWESNDEIFRVHYGGWENGHWGVIDRNGIWLAEPVFENIDDVWYKGKIIFYSDNRFVDPPMGVYDTDLHKVRLEPQYTDIEILEDGRIDVTLFDEKLGRQVEKILGPDGKEKFHSDYSEIRAREGEKAWWVSVKEDGKTKYGLIDQMGNEILPCIYEGDWPNVSSKNKRMCIRRQGKEYMLDFEGNIIIPEKFSSIEYIDYPLCVVSVNTDSGLAKKGLMDLNGKEIVAPEYSEIKYCDESHILCCKEGKWEMLEVTLTN